MVVAFQFASPAAEQAAELKYKSDPFTEGVEVGQTLFGDVNCDYFDRRTFQVFHNLEELVSGYYQLFG